MDEALQIRVHADGSGPPLVYLPGLHGDWTLVAAFRGALVGRVPFVEVTYPRTLTWSLADYAREIDTALVARGLEAGWLLAESFGSQVAWAMLAEKSRRFRVHGVIFASDHNVLGWAARAAADQAVAWMGQTPTPGA